MAIPVNPNTWQSDFSGYDTWLYVVDNKGKHFLINHKTKTRYSAKGPGARNALSALYGDPIEGVFLTNYKEPTSAVDLFGGGNEMERVISGRKRNPLTGEYVDNPQTIRAGDGTLFQAVDAGQDVGDAVPETPEAPEEEGFDPSRDAIQEVRAQLQWMPGELLDEYVASWTEHGSGARAIQDVRQSDLYEEFFPGNLRDDGSVHLKESQYLANVESYREDIASYGIPADTFDHLYPELIQKGVSPSEFSQRTSNRYSQVVLSGEPIRQFYADEFGAGDISDRALLADLLDPDLNPVEFQQQFRTSVVGGTAARFGFDVALEEAERMADFIGSREASQQFFSRAQGFLPRLGALVERHDDPDSDFDLSEFADAVVFGDADQRERIERLLAQESASFSPVSPRNLRPR